MDTEKIPRISKKAAAINKTFFAKLIRTRPDDLDAQFHKLHEEVFEKTDCSQCANCCKTTSPIFYQKDIEKLSKYFRIRPSQFIEKYLHVDEDDDYVLNTSPCAFLRSDNSCSVYEQRPLACREYPHTNRKKMYQLLDITSRNTAVCPAVFDIVEKLKRIY